MVNTSKVPSSSFHESPSLGELDEAYYRGQSDAYAGGIFDDTDDHYEDVIDAGFIAITRKIENPYQYNQCKASFASKNNLHQHLPSCMVPLGDMTSVLYRDTSKVPSEQNRTMDHILEEIQSMHVSYIPEDTASAQPNNYPKVIHSDAKPINSTGYAFRGWQYTTVQASCYATGPREQICLDSGYTMSLGDRKFLRRLIPNFESKVKTMASPIPVRGVGSKIHHTNQFVVIEICIQDTLPDGTTAIAKIQREVHIVEDLKVNILIGVDILAPERMLVDLDTRPVTIRTCRNLTASITIMTRDNPNTQRLVRAKTHTVVPPFSYLQVSVKVKDFPKDRDFIFEPGYDNNLGEKGGLYTHVVDVALSFVHLRNDTNRAVTIQRHARLGMIMEFNENGCFLANPVDHPLALSRPSWKSKLFTGTAALASIFPGAVTNKVTSAKTKVGSSETTLPNGVTVFGTPVVAEQLATLVESFPVWTDHGMTVNILEDS